jgi:Tol biopolymer transport system component
MNRYFSRLACLALVLALGPGCDSENPVDPGPDGNPPTGPSTASIQGTVSIGDSPMLGIQVALSGPAGNRTASTVADGSFVFTDLPLGAYVVTAAVAGATCNSASADVQAGQTAAVTIACDLALAPEVETSDAGIGLPSTTVTLNGVVNPHGIATDTWFEWGPSNGSLSHQTPIQLVSDTASRAVSVTIHSLEPATTYYYRAVARNEVDTRHGRTLSFVVPSSLPPPGTVRGRLAFVRAGDIYVYDPTSESTLQLTSGGNFGYPAWSPDGSRIAFSQVNQGPGQIHVINADGSGLQLVGEGRSPAWSPDGRRLAFAAWHNGQGAIFVKSVDDPSQPAVRIGFDTGYHDFPAWSPDGTRIAFASDWVAYDFAFEVFIANADGSGEVHQVTDGFFGNYGNFPTYLIYAQPSWSPDGRSLAVVECYEWQFASCANSQVGVMGVDGSGFRLLANTTGFARPGWAPDGSAVVFSRTCWDHNCPSAIFEVALDGTNERLLIEDAHSGVFSP